MKRIASLLLTILLVLTLSLPALAASTSAFPDVPAGHWAAGEIAAADQAGLFQGDERGNFLPEATLTRASFVTVLCRMFGWETLSPAAATYSDCLPGAWYYGAVETAAAHGVTDGSDSFRPDDAITRSEIAVMLIQALGYDSLAAEAVSAGLSLPFADVSSSDPDAGYLLLAYQIGLTNGVETGGQLLFKPEGTASRAEAAAMVMRVYARYTSKLAFLHGFYAFSSYSQLSLTGAMDAVSVGWSALQIDGNGAPALVSDSTGGNEWIKPSGAEEVTSYLAQHGTACHLNVYALSDSDGTLAALLADSGRRAETVALLVQAAADYDGLTLDFEGLRAAQKASFTSFVTELRAALGGDKTLYVCVQPDDWYDGYDYRALGESADRLIVMAHDYAWSTPEDYVGTANTDNPPASLPDVYRTLSHVLDPDTGVTDRSKVVLAISIDSVGLPIDEQGTIRSTEQASPAPSTLIQRLRQADAVLGWSEEYATAWANYTTEDGGRWLVWYEDVRSVAAKSQLARMLGLGGISLWRLGNLPAYDDAGLNYQVWEAVTAQR